MRSPLMDGLSDLDPARHVRAPGTPRDAALQQILGAERTLPVRKARRSGLMVGTAAAAATALAVGITWASTLDAPVAYASWVAVPATPDGVPAGIASCPGTVPAVGTIGQDPPIRDVPVAPVLVEVRGDYTYAVQAGDGVVADCFVSTADGTPTVFSSSAAGVEPEDVGPTDLVVLQQGVASWSRSTTSEGGVTSAYGRAGGDVRAVSVTLADGERVEASVDDGWWAVWAPGEEGFDGPAEVTLTDGTTTQVALTVAAP
jgi:hypothetical protein